MLPSSSTSYQWYLLSHHLCFIPIHHPPCSSSSQHPPSSFTGMIDSFCDPCPFIPLNVTIFNLPSILIPIVNLKYPWMTNWDTMSPSNGLSLDPQRLWHWLQVKLWRVDGGRSWSDVCQVDPWRKPSGDDARSWRYQCQWSKLLVCNCFCHLGVANEKLMIFESVMRIDPYVLFVIHMFYPWFSVICFIIDDVTIGSLQRKTSSNAWRERMEEEEQVWVAGCWASRRHLKHCR